jgi:hypothetical protein
VVTFDDAFALARKIVKAGGPFANDARRFLKSAGVDVPDSNPHASVVFACTHIGKRITEDNFLTGTDGTEEYTMDTKVNIVSDTLPGLLRAIGNAYALDIEEISIPPCMDDQPDNITEIQFYRDEDEQNDPPSESYREQWKDGKKRIWYACFELTIERRVISPITREEIEESVKVD